MRPALLLVLFLPLQNLMAQYPDVETVGNPNGNVPVSSYTGWANTPSTATFTGTAMVQNSEPSTTSNASGFGNVWFDAVPGTWFEVTLTNVPPCGYYPNITFLMHNFDTTAASNQLILEYSTDNGTSYQQLSYRRLGMHMFQSGLWNVMETEGIVQPAPCSAASYKVRFRQTSSNTKFSN